MKVMVIVKASKESEAGAIPSQELLAEMGKFNEQLVNAGLLLAGEGLHPSSKGARVRFSGSDRKVIDGPFAETKELIAGFWMWRVKSLQEAIDWVKKCPNPHDAQTEIEIRPVFEADDFGENFTPELREQEASIRAKALGLESPRFENAGKLLIAGFNNQYTSATRSKIPEQWQRFSYWFGKIPNQLGTYAYGVCWNFKPDCGFDYLTGVQVSDTGKLPAEFVHVPVPAQRYAVFPHQDHVSKIGATIDTIWSKWVPDAGLHVAQTPWFERYAQEFNPRTGLGGMEIWIPLLISD